LGNNNNQRNISETLQIARIAPESKGKKTSAYYALEPLHNKSFQQYLNFFPKSDSMLLGKLCIIVETILSFVENSLVVCCQ
jgi:hypothetical protein